MSSLCLLGAAGNTGQLVARELAAQGVDFVACGRDVERVRRVTAPVAHAVADVRRVDVREPSTLARALAGVRTAISTIGPYDRLGRAVVEAAIGHGVHLLDVSGEQSYVRWVHEVAGDDARRAGVTLVPGAGFTGLVGDLLAAIAASAAGERPELHIAYTTLGGGRRTWSAGTRRSAAGMLGAGTHAYVDGRLHAERLGEERRLAWFPRPVGPMHAAAVPGIEAVSVPRHVADVRTVRTYLAMSSWKAEGMQAIGNLSRFEPVRRRLTAWLERAAPDPSEGHRAATRWACVAEAQGTRGVARAWAYGRDPYAVSASAAVLLARRTEDAGTAPGAVPPAGVSDPSSLLDDLSVRTDVRWSVMRPEA